MNLSDSFRSESTEPDSKFDPVQFTLDALDQIIHKKNNPELDIAFKDLQAALQAPSPIANYMQKAFSADNKVPGLFPDEIPIFGNSLVFAVSFATRRISHCTSLLNKFRYYGQANIITENLFEEAGDDDNDSHLNLLFDTLGILTNSLNVNFLGSTSYHQAETLWSLRQIPGEENLCKTNDTVHAWKEYIAACKKYIDVDNATQQIRHFHYLIEQTYRSNFSDFIRRPDYVFGHALDQLNTLPPDIGKLAYRHNSVYNSNMSPEDQLISSVLEHVVLEADAARQSHIWAYHSMLKQYAGAINIFDRERAFKWSSIHISDETGVEDEHVRQGVQAACSVIRYQSTKCLIKGVRSAAEVVKSRNRHMLYTTQYMQQARNNNLAAGYSPIPPKPGALPNSLKFQLCKASEIIKISLNCTLLIPYLPILLLQLRGFPKNLAAVHGLALKKETPSAASNAEELTPKM